MTRRWTLPGKSSSPNYEGSSANLVKTGLPLQSALGSETGRRRRSTRVLLTLPVVISGIDENGRPFETDGETISVNKHGARIRVKHLLRCTEVRITIRSQQRSQQARVVYVDETHESEYGIELEKPENFWGVYFPPADWESPGMQQSEESRRDVDHATKIEGS